MANLFQINGTAVFPNPETLLISPFKEIWERDPSPKKEVAIQEFAYIEFMSSMLRSNPYREYPIGRREEIIRETIITVLDWNPDEYVLKGMEWIHNIQMEGSISYTYWLSNKRAIEKMIEFFDNVDIDERNFKSGNPLYKPRDITSAVSDAEKMLVALNGLKKKVDEELFESTKMRSDKVISPFADPNSIKGN